KLQQRNRLDTIAEETVTAEAEATKAAAALGEATALLADRQNEDRQAREALQAAFAALNDARATYAQQEKEATAITAKLEAADQALREIAGEMEQVRNRGAAIEDERRNLPDIETMRATTAKTRSLLAEQRGRESGFRSERDRLLREQDHINLRTSA